MLARISRRLVSVRHSICLLDTRWYCRITQVTLHNSPGILVFWY